MTRDKDSILHLYNKVLPTLATRIHINMAEITPLFDDFGLEKIVDIWTRNADASDETQISIENGNVQHMCLKLRLEGFQRAGAPAFDVTKDLLFKLSHTTYDVGSGKNSVWLEKLYYEAWTEDETADIAQRWCEEVVDEITQHLERLT